MNLQINIADGSASVILAILVVQLSIYLHISIQQNHPLSIPILVLIISLSVLFGALQVVINTCTTCDKCLLGHTTAEEAEEEEEEVEEEEVEEEAEEEEEEEVEEEEEEAKAKEEPLTDKSLQQLREFAAKIQELNLKNVCSYNATNTILNPEEIFEPHHLRASIPEVLNPILEGQAPEFPEPEVLESALVADLVQSETPI